MTKWEYCSVDWKELIGSRSWERFEDLPDEEWHKVETDDDRVAVCGWLNLPGEESRNIETLRPILSDLGKDGWEMVSHTRTSPRLPASVLVNVEDLDLLPSGTMETFYFKRPIED